MEQLRILNLHRITRGSLLNNLHRSDSFRFFQCSHDPHRDPPLIYQIFEMYANFLQKGWFSTEWLFLRSTISISHKNDVLKWLDTICSNVPSFDRFLDFSPKIIGRGIMFNMMWDVSWQRVHIGTTFKHFRKKPAKIPPKNLQKNAPLWSCLQTHRLDRFQKFLLHEKLQSIPRSYIYNTCHLSPRNLWKSALKDFGKIRSREIRFKKIRFRDLPSQISSCNSLQNWVVLKCIYRPIGSIQLRGNRNIGKYSFWQQQQQVEVGEGNWVLLMGGKLHISGSNSVWGFSFVRT